MLRFCRRVEDSVIFFVFVGSLFVMMLKKFVLKCVVFLFGVIVIFFIWRSCCGLLLFV